MKNITIALAIVAAASSHAIVSSSFDAGLDGWSMVYFDPPGAAYGTENAAGGLTWNATGGNPDGYISREDVEGGAMMFKANSSYTGDQSANIGGTLSFDLICDFDDRTVDSVVVIKGAGLTIAGSFANPVINTWTTRSVVLDAANFNYGFSGGSAVSTTDFNSVMASIDGLYISGEFHTGFPAEITGLDNVSLEPVPEPATMALLGFGAAALAARKRRKA